MNWRLVLILLKLIDRFGFPYFLVFVSFWLAKAIEQELQMRVTSPSLSSRWSALSAKQRHKKSKAICHEKNYEILTGKSAVHWIRHSRGTCRSNAANSRFIMHAAASGPGRVVVGGKQCP